MTDIILHTEREQNTTAVSNIFIDNYIPNANGEFVKIYLYLLRLLSHDDCHFSLADMADKFNYTESDIHRGLAYWEKLDLLKLEYDQASNLIGICFLQPKERLVSAEVVASTRPAPVSTIEVSTTKQTVSDENITAKKPVSTQPHAYSMQEIADFKDCDGVTDLLFAAEHYLHHTLTANDLNTMMYWYEALHFPVDLIEYLIEYCIDKGHPNIYYMNKVALNWADGGIFTVEDAKQSASIHSQTYYAIMKAFGITGRNLVEKEIAFVEKWTNEFGFTLDIINEACSRTIQNTGRASFGYADSILTSWHEKSIRHLEDIETLDKNFSSADTNKKQVQPNKTANNRFHNFNQRVQDDDYYDDLEKKLLRK